MTSRKDECGESDIDRKQQEVRSNKKTAAGSETKKSKREKRGGGKIEVEETKIKKQSESRKK